MCGLVGVIGDICREDKKVFDFLIGIDTCRGKDSAGVARAPALLKNRAKVDVIKEVGTGYDLQWVPEYWNGGNRQEGVIKGEFAFLMGHNRWATIGKVTNDNAHPFICGSIVGAQNGTLPDYWRKKLLDWDQYETDTEALFHNIDVRGVENVIPHIDGAWALTWYNTEDDTFHILRNEERPLCFAWKKNGKTMYYASEPWMLYAASDKFKIEFENETVYWFPEDTHYTWKIGSVYDFSRKRQSSSPLKGWEHQPHVVVSKNYGTSSSTSSGTTVVSNSGGTVTNGSTSTGSNPFITEIKNEIEKLIANQNDSPMQKASYWQTKLGTYKEFAVSGALCTDEQGKQYIKGVTVDGGVTIRFYPSATKDLHAILGDKDVQTFAVKIKRVKLSAKGTNFYLLPDTDTIMVATYRGSHFRKGDAPIDMELGDELPWNDLFTVGGVPVSEKEWKDRTSGGCAWCSHVPSTNEAGSLTWLKGNHDFLCADCSENPDVKQYVNQFNS